MMFTSFLKNIVKMFHPSYSTLFLEYAPSFQPRASMDPHPVLMDQFRSQQEEFSRVMSTAAGTSAEFCRSIRQAGRTGQDGPAFDNGYMTPLDMLLLYTMVRNVSPVLYIEVGSGTSTKVALTAKRDCSLATEIVSIDPQPRIGIANPGITHLASPLQRTDLAVFSKLQENDIVFIDSSHRVLPNSDMTVFFLEILPRLPKGVFVHFHDIYLPYDYPQLNCDRFYSEQYFIALLLLEHPQRYHVILPAYHCSTDISLSPILEPLWNELPSSGTQKDGCSLWIQIR